MDGCHIRELFGSGSRMVDNPRPRLKSANRLASVNWTPIGVESTRMSTKKKDTSNKGRIAQNKRARYEYAIEERFEAGVALQGWEVKSIREGKIQFGESYALIRDGELYLFGAQISPLLSASTHVIPDAMRNRKLLLHRNQIDQLIGAVERKGFSLIPTTMYWKNGKIKVELGLGKGKKQHDKRATEKDRDWEREKGRIMRDNSRGKAR